MWSGPRNNKVKGTHKYCIKIEVSTLVLLSTLGYHSVFGYVVANNFKEYSIFIYKVYYYLYGFNERLIQY